MPDDEDTAGDDASAARLKEWNTFFHKASSLREERFKKSILKEFETVFGTKLQSLTDTLTASIRENLGLKEGALAPDSAPKLEVPPGTGQPSGLTATQLAELRQAQKDLKDAVQRSERSEQKAKEAEERNMRNEERTQLLGLLNGRVKPSLMDMTLGTLSSNIVRDPDSGAILWKDASGDLLPLKDGVEAWSKSDVGKEVAPPRPAAGAGSRGSGDGSFARGQEVSMADLGAFITGAPR